MKLYWRYKKDGKWTWKRACSEGLGSNDVHGYKRYLVRLEDDPKEGEE